MKRSGLLFIVALCASGVFGKPATPPFSAYQPIIDRMPFGAAPDPLSFVTPTTVDERKAQAEAAKLAQQINMSALTIMPDGRTAIGFTDVSVKPPMSYYLPVGETAGGWTVVDADYDEDTATIMSKDGIEITLQLGKGLVQPAAPLPPGRVAAENALAAASQINATVQTRNLGASMTVPLVPAGGAANLPPGLVRATPGTTTQTTPRAPANTISYRDRLNNRVADQQAEQEAETRKQEEQMKRAAAAALEEARRRQQAEDAAQQALDDMDYDLVPAQGRRIRMPDLVQDDVE